VEYLGTLLNDMGFSAAGALWGARGILVAAALLLAFLADLITKRILITLIGKIVKKTANSWDDILFRRKLFNKLSRIAPVVVLYLGVDLIFQDIPSVAALLQRILMAYTIGLIIVVAESLISSVNDIYQSYPISKKRPIKGYLQILKVFLYILGVILIITTIMNKSALGLLGGLGAMSAVILLVFRDSILGLVASVQLSANNMISIGDWVEMPSYGVDGEVTDVTLQTVTVQNWDKTIATVPIYTLISSSFRNWRGMTESGGRRIKRAIKIDMNSIRFCDASLLEQLRRFRLLKDFLEKREREIAEHNRQLQIDEEVEYFNGRRLTNIGVFRAYVAAYLHQHPLIHDEMTFLVRHLPPSEHGLPLEIYVFSKDQRWAFYENIQADIFDHLLAVLPLFDLAVYQAPGSLDLRLLAGKDQ
jgi:miniconductance mechanosensitive channel